MIATGTVVDTAQVGHLGGGLKPFLADLSASVTATGAAASAAEVAASASAASAAAAGATASAASAAGAASAASAAASASAAAASASAAAPFAQSVFASRAQLEAVSVNALVVAVTTMGRYAAGDGGRCKYTRAGAQPSVPGWCRSADGAYWAYADEVSNLRAHSAKGDAVQNPTTGVWTGTDDTQAAKDWEACGAALGIKRYAPKGTYLVADRITVSTSQGFQNSSNVDIYGDGPETIFISTNTGSPNTGMWRYGGTTDADTSVTAYLTAPAVAGDIQITVNDSTLLAADQWVMLIDHSQTVIDPHTLAVVCRIGQVARINAIVDATHVTLYDQIEFPLTANAGSPISATTIRRYTAPIENIRFRDFSVYLDPTLTYINTNFLIQVRRALNVRADNINEVMPALNSQVDGIVFWDCINYKVKDCRSFRKTSTAYYIKVPGSHFGQIDNIRLIGGRHAIDSAPGTVDGIEASFVEVSNGIASGTFYAPWQTHPGARNWTFNNCTAAHGAFGVTQADEAGFMLRGRFHTVNGGQVIGHKTGVYSVFGYDHRVIGVDIESCAVGVRTNLTSVVEFRGNKIKNPRTNGIVISPSAGCVKLYFRDNDVIGNPSGAAFLSTATWDPTWKFERNSAPDATTLFSGIPTTFAWKGYGTVTGGTVTPDPFVIDSHFYTNNGAHTLAPAANYGRYMLDITNAAAAGAITTSGWSKVTGDAFTTTNGKTFRCKAEIGPAGSSLSVTAF